MAVWAHEMCTNKKTNMVFRHYFYSCGKQSGLSCLCTGQEEKRPSHRRISHLPLQELHAAAFTLASSGVFVLSRPWTRRVITSSSLLDFLPPDCSTSIYVILQRADYISLKEKRRLAVVLSLYPITSSRKRHREDVQRPVCCGFLVGWVACWQLQEALAVVVVVWCVTLCLCRLCRRTSRQVHQLSPFISNCFGSVFKSLFSSQLVAIAMSLKYGLWWESLLLISYWPSSSLFLCSALWRNTSNRGTLTVSAAFLFLMSLSYFYTHIKMCFNLFKQGNKINRQ